MIEGLNRKLGVALRYVRLLGKYLFVKLVRSKNGKGDVTVNDIPVKISNKKDILTLAREMKRTDKIGNDFPMPKNISDLTVDRNATKEEKAEVIANAQANNIEEDPSDDWLEYGVGERPRPKIPFQSKEFPIPKPLREEYEEGWYPAGGANGKKVNINALKVWVANVKLIGMSDDEIEEEYYQMRETEEFQQFASVDKKVENLISTMKHKRRNPQTTKRLLIDSIAYMVARKIWYAGRKPVNMTDWDWNEHTKYMRPHEGSFGQGDVWNKMPFKYDENYIYESGRV